MSETKDEIIRLGDFLLRQKGYNAFSYADISKKLDIKNAAVHYHFPTKSDLVVSIIQAQKERFEQFKKDTREKKSIDKVNAFLNIYSQIQSDQKICLVGALATDWETIDDKSQKELHEMASAIIQWLASVLNEGLKNNEFNFKETPRTKALLIVSNMLAATQIARIFGEKDFNTIKSSVLKSLKQ